MADKRLTNIFNVAFATLLTVLVALIWRQIDATNRNTTSNVKQTEIISTLIKKTDTMEDDIDDLREKNTDFEVRIATLETKVSYIERSNAK